MDLGLYWKEWQEFLFTDPHEYVSQILKKVNWVLKSGKISKFLPGSKYIDIFRIHNDVCFNVLWIYDDAYWSLWGFLDLLLHFRQIILCFGRLSSSLWMFHSISGLWPVDTNTAPNGDKQKCLQELRDVPRDEATLTLIDNHRLICIHFPEMQNILILWNANRSQSVWVMCPDFMVVKGKLLSDHYFVLLSTGRYIHCSIFSSQLLFKKITEDIWCVDVQRFHLK